MTVLGYLGPKGTFTYGAASAYITCQRETYELHSERSIFSLFEGLKRVKYEYIIVPVENSLEGAVTMTMDALVRLEGFQIVNEVVMSINQSLLAKKGTHIKDISTIVSHVQPIAQCRDYLDTKFSDISIHEMGSTAIAAAHVQQSSEALAVIGHESLAGFYGLDILDSNIQDSQINKTRFLVIGNGKTESTGNDKTSLVFSTPQDEPGSLVRILSLFSDQGINLTKIESRPDKTRLGSYLFFVDCEGHCLDEAVKGVLSNIEAKAPYFKILGAYPMGVTL